MKKIIKLIELLSLEADRQTKTNIFVQTHIFTYGQLDLFSDNKKRIMILLILKSLTKKD